MSSNSVMMLTGLRVKTVDMIEFKCPAYEGIFFLQHLTFEDQNARRNATPFL